MLVRFLQDYQGKPTGPHFYRKGQEVELAPPVALLLVVEEMVVLVEELPDEPAEPAKRGKRK